VPTISRGEKMDLNQSQVRHSQSRVFCDPVACILSDDSYFAGTTSDLHVLYNEWKAAGTHCKPDECMIRKGTKIRVVRKNQMDRMSQPLRETWGINDMIHVVMCSLHADMRLSEGILAAFFRKALMISNNRAEQLNTLLEENCKIATRFVKQKDHSGYTQFGLTGVDCRKLREKDGGTIKLVLIIRILFAEDSAYIEHATRFLNKYVVVMENLRCRDPTTEGLRDLGKHCSDFSVLWFSLFPPANSSMKFYLHTVVHHAGQWQKFLLDEYKMCIGMFENSAFEKRHFLGRSAFSKSLRGLMFMDKGVPNPHIHAIMRILMKHQHGLDIISLNNARKEKGLPLAWSFSELATESQKKLDSSLAELRAFLEREETTVQRIQESIRDLDDQMESTADTGRYLELLKKRRTLLESSEGQVSTFDDLSDVIRVIQEAELDGTEWEPPSEGNEGAESTADNHEVMQPMREYLSESNSEDGDHSSLDNDSSDESDDDLME